MALGLHNLRPAKGARKKRKRVGRGDASGHGTYSGRGMKGQRARSGGKGGLKLKGFKQRIQQTPKLRGFKSYKPKMETVNLRDLELKFKDGDVVNPQKLVEVNLIKDTRSGVKILGDGKLTKKLVVRANAFSKSAERGIVEAGGRIELISEEMKK